MSSEDLPLACPLCGQAHSRPLLKPGQRALCIRCGTALMERGRLGPDAAMAFAATGLVLALPSLLLPFVTLAKLGRERTVFLTGGFEGFWRHGFEPVGAWVLFCGTLAPFGLLALLLAVLWTDRREPFAGSNRSLRRLAQGVEYWSMPEVQVLGVLVAFFKLGDVVDVFVGPGLWCYGAASLMTLLAWRTFSLQPRRERGPRSLTPASSSS